MRSLFAPLVCLLLTLAPAAPAAEPIPPDAVSFCTPADVEARFDGTALAQRTGDPTGQALDQTKLTAAVDDFAALMAPYVAGRYPGVDFGTAEPTLNAINTEGAYIELGKRKPLGLTDGERQDRRALFRQLEQIAAGHASLVVPETADPDAGFVDVDDAWRANPRLMGRRTWTPPYGL